MANSYSISAIQGDALNINLSIKDKNNIPVNLSGYDVRGVVKYAYGYTGNSGILLDLNPLIYSGVNGSYYSSGIINISVDSSKTRNLPVGSFVYDVERFTKNQPTGNSIIKSPPFFPWRLPPAPSSPLSASNNFLCLYFERI